jgi:hypothetical protein
MNYEPVAGDILFYQHSVPNGTGNQLRNASSTQSIKNYKLRTDGTGNAATLSRQGQNVGRKQNRSQTTVPSGTECVYLSPV